MATPHYQMLLIHTAFIFLLIFCLETPSDGSGPTQWKEVSCELVGDFISSYSSRSRDAIQPHSVSGSDIIQRSLPLSHQWGRCFDSLQDFQSRLAVGAHTEVFLWPCFRLNFIDTGHDGMHRSLKNCSKLF